MEHFLRHRIAYTLCTSGIYIPITAGGDEYRKHRTVTRYRGNKTANARNGYLSFIPSAAENDCNGQI
jgi:hypothetical protein